MNDIIFAMSEAFATDVTNKGPGAMYSFVIGERLDGGKLFGTGVAGIRGFVKNGGIVVGARRRRRRRRSGMAGGSGGEIGRV